jgi:hypothetical protein
MIAFKDEHTINFTREAELNDSIANVSHSPKIIHEHHRLTCCVCQLEGGIQNQLRKTEEGKQQLIQAMRVRSVEVIRFGVYNRKWLASCYHEACTVVAYHICIDSDNFIFKREEFQELTCFQIAHHPTLRGLWNCKQSRDGTIAAEMGDQKRKPRVREVNTSHMIFLSLHNDYGLGSITRKRSRACYC